MLIKIDSENYINSDHIVALTTFSSTDGNVKITIDTVTSASGHGPYVVNFTNLDDAKNLINEIVKALH